MADATRSHAPQASPAGSDSETPGFDYHPAWGLIGVTLGVLVILAAGYYETQTQPNRPFVNLLYGFEDAPEWVDPMTIYSRRMPKNEFPQVYDAVEEFRDSAQGAQRDEIEALINATGLMDTERIISAPLTEEDLELALASGRIPEPGKAELLGGAFARLDEFSVDGQTFRVVGRLRRSVAGFHFAYLIPTHPAWQPMFEEHPATETGWLAVNGRDALRGQADPMLLAEESGIEIPRVPADPRITAATISGLMLVGIFGAMAHLSLFRLLLPRRCGPFRPALRVMITRPRLVILMHLLLFGGFFSMMLLATRLPVPNMWLGNLIRYTFTHGDLEYIGDAYASKNILLAAWATFVNNYILQTLGLTFGISFVIPCIGILKTLLSFVMVGFGMSPIWSGMAMGFSYHSITMTLELEAYVIACVLVFYFWSHVGMALFKGEFGRRFKEGLLATLSGLLLTGFMLGFAALYEAVTLILAA